MLHLTLRRFAAAVAILGLIAAGSIAPLAADPVPDPDSQEEEGDGWSDGDSWVEEVVDILLDYIDREPDTGAKIEGDGKA